MPSSKNRIVDFLITRSFATKTAILVIGTGIILLGTEIRPEYPVVGILVLLFGLMADWGVVWIVYIEITRIRDDIESAESRIEMASIEIDRAKKEIDTAKREIDNTKRDVMNTKEDVDQTKREIEDVRERAFERSFTSLEYRLDEIERALEGLRRP